MPIILRNSTKDFKIIPLVPLRQGVVFPHTEAVLTFGRTKSVSAINASFRSNRLICFVSQKSPVITDPSLADMYQVGTLCRIQRTLKTNGEINALVKGLSRVKIEALRAKEPFLLAAMTEIPEIIDESNEVQALTRHLRAQLKKAVNLGKPIDFLVFMHIMSGVTPIELVDQAATLLDIKNQQRQEILEIIEVRKRLEKVNDYLSSELKILEIESSINLKTQKKFDKSMRETVLRERMKTIQKELGEEEEDKEISDLKIKIKEVKMPPEVEKKALKEASRLGKMHAYNPEAGYIRTYLDWLVEMPWSKKTPNNVSIKNAKKVLEEDHYGLKEVKERVLEYLAVMKLKELKNRRKKKNKKGKKEVKSPTILCFVGPPGVGKTSMGKSIARALGRKFVRISLGGIRDEAEIRGHRRTYVGSMPGRIIQGIKNSGTKNPVFMLDEIDKVGTDFRGDPSSALLEALDPEQNSEFSDHYLEVPFNLSETMFITTANILETIPPALKDRLEIIRFSGYTYDEKYKIARKFLIDKTLRANALGKNQVEVPTSVLKKIIERYTREAGVRNLEREISKVMRKVATKIAQRKRGKVKISLKDLAVLLGPTKFKATLIEKKDGQGISTGLAWTESGGDILFIEVALMPGKGKLILTGQLGDVMKESCRAALSYIRSHWHKLGIKKEATQGLDIHVHVPEGAVPKDGPSAGIAIATALTSALTGRKVRREVGMTGEITLRGRVLEIGGLKEKVIAAHRAGLKEIILPEDNKKNLIKVPQKIKKDFKFHFANTLDQVLKVALK
ncbi:endopeptidase La [Candidatus Beckwithbacteria bacterium CG10_big_fil_rev_8_21_14_0_10_34_10]|uniref:Lon protease n=1 Tax=Candidatus Beckwithbacteria bacterium CG10_big_fil_rev_8_21_14_0_10_34_10 TaxID=1974495 RepID=A0A2H0W8L1_9BACT|nr:MAG: endopeptidase La [Candidatus Beckwithbacteria bacterium CG10_big_fil_rev_8_21_14_0_10_34_10]